MISFREQTGWDVDETGGLSRTVHPSRLFYVVVRTGDDSTGLFGRCPTPKTGLRTILRNLIDGTPNMAPLFEIAGTGKPVSPPADTPQLWLLMFVLRNGVMYSELSRPAARVEDRITRYHERIPLPPLPYTRADTSVIVTPDDDLGAGPEIDVRPI